MLSGMKDIQKYCNSVTMVTGIKFIALTDPRQGGVDALLRKMYEVFSDFALKNPFYSVDMPVR